MQAIFDHTKYEDREQMELCGLLISFHFFEAYIFNFSISSLFLFLSLSSE